MAKGKLDRPGKGPGTSTRAIGMAIIQEWISIIRGGAREMNPQALGALIRAELVSGGHGRYDGQLEVGIITDPVNQELDAAGRKVKFIWVCIPAPDQVDVGWITNCGYATELADGSLVPNDGKAEDLGEAVLFGCGR